MTSPPDILQKILQRKAEEIAARSEKITLKTLRSQIEDLAPPRGFFHALETQRTAQRAGIIAEIKKASPSKGLLRDPFYPDQLASNYQQYGATCLSVLTDQDFFQGHDDYLRQARAACQLPVLRKDFMIDDYQIYESRVLGADCILLIISALGEALLHDLAGLALDLGMDVLVEVHDHEELERALTLKIPFIGINNRDLRTFNVSLQTTLDLLKYIPNTHLVVTESGIHQSTDVQLMLNAGVSTFLIGETFMRAENPGLALSQLFDFSAAG
ncbi:indole-3-glycerol phosphate synthase TrpC [Thioflexithrix psekupsensis]|uniref:Indole-3-glycerol phosphate synthase n=1 Tax=Thioflexithrix psekupsensis TaxID=1570016 RepID=A0A251X6H1_9GAMM|nr:indole-3-glycerol phosphate synthase TrpC [Thioflexithrix psekupsensis]OUD13253.1 indole-3-glycerol-phosphate synthase [Thioflexithrix psekupsensis]